MVTADAHQVQRIATAAQPHIPPGFTGQIILHAHQGSVAKISVLQSFKPSKGEAS